MSGLPAFDRYIGIDYSGAETPVSSLKGLRIYMADRNGTPTEVQPPPSPRKYWTRREIAEWLVELLSERQPTLVGIDHGFSFPLRYFDEHHRTIGRHFSTIFNAIGRQMTNTPTLILCAMASVAMVLLDPETLGGDASQKKEPGRSPFSTSTCPDRLLSPRTPGCRGCAISAFTSPPFTLGLSMAGRYRRDGPS